jgi:hypothetical protein
MPESGRIIRFSEAAALAEELALIVSAPGPVQQTSGGEMTHPPNLLLKPAPEYLERAERTAGLSPFRPRKEGAMPALNRAGAEPATPARTPPPGLPELAEGRLRGKPYLALRNLSCDCRGGVLVLRGRLPTYYLKQVAQEAVARLEGVERIDNQIQVVTPANPSRRG